MNVTFDQLKLHPDAKQEQGTSFRLLPDGENQPNGFLRIRQDGEQSETEKACEAKVVAQLVDEFQLKFRHKITGIPDFA